MSSAQGPVSKARRAGCNPGAAGLGGAAGAGVLAVGLTASRALAQITQEEALDSIRQNMGQPVDLSMVGWVLAGGVAVLALLVFLGHQRKARRVPKALNHQGKLVRELSKAVGLKPAEVKKVRNMAEQLKGQHGVEVENPMVLLLCPSLLAKAMKKKD